MSARIDFYFDFSSSYSYVSLPRVQQISSEYDVTVAWKPIVLGAIFKSLGHAPPSAGSIKMQYMNRDLERCAEAAGLPPFVHPESFPFNSISASRVFWHLQQAAGEAAAIEWAQSVFGEAFAKGRDCSDPAVLGDVATRLGHDADALLAATSDEAVKARLKEVTGEAMERGVFGAPTFYFDGEIYWGGDRLAHIARLLDHS